MHAHPDDLKLLTDQFGEEANLGLAYGGIVLAASQLAAQMEPHLIWSDQDEVATSRARWTYLLAQLSWTLERWKQGEGEKRPPLLPAKDLHELAAIAQANWRGTGCGPVTRFPFVADEKLRAIAERDYRSLESALKADDTKVALVLAGCVVEAILLDYLETALRQELVAAAKRVNGKEGGNRKKLEPTARPANWSFENMIAVCGPDGLKRLDERAIKMADVVRKWRNFIHPNREREERRLKPAEATAAQALVELVIDDFSADAGLVPTA